MKIYLGSDHRGFLLKEKVFAYLAKYNYEVEDVGGRELNPDDDFPQFAAKVVGAMAGDPSYDVRGVLICGSGQGMCMAANRFKGIRAALGYDQESVRSARNYDDSNVLAIRHNEAQIQTSSLNRLKVRTRSFGKEFNSDAP